MELFSYFKRKEVINICDGMRLGFTTDLEIDLHTGRICKIIVTEGSRCLNFFCEEKEYRVPWECIKKIGDDIILVDVSVEKVVWYEG